MKALEALGGGVLRQLSYVGGLTLQFWAGLRATGRTLPLVGKRGRWRAVMRQIVAIGVEALPMIGIVSACAGFIVAIQVAAELRRFGALSLVVDVVAIGFTRELGPLVTAIVVSGRSGSAISAEIGTMVVANEIDALRTMAIDPIEFVLAPKSVAAMIAVPCLAVMSNVFGIMAGAVFMRFSAGMAFPIYLKSVAEAILLRDVFLGVLKSCVFAAIVVHVGCLEGFKVRGGPESVGRSTTSAVVKSTFLVILADLFFTAVVYMVEAR